MARFNTARVCLGGFVDWLHGCSHRKTTFPITLPASAGGAERQNTEAETYIVCLECGRHFAYDWSTMQVSRHLAV